MERGSSLNDADAEMAEAGGVGAARPSGAAPVLTLAIGASAGGVEALEQFFDRMRPDSGIAFVVVQHLSPDFRSLMDEILARHTTMPVRVAGDGQPVLPNTVYVNPAGKQLGVEQGRLRVTERDKGEIRPIDHFLRALAADAGSRAGAIILSGTGSDGAEGIGDIKRAGGLVLAQEPGTAQFDGMPRAAVASGHVDVTLAPEQMPPMLLSLVFQDAVSDAAPMVASARALWPIIPLLHDAYGIDFGEYKVPTLARRTERRVRALGSASVEEYAARLRTDPAELDALYRDLLIGVTQFFRDAEAFERLGSIWLPRMLKRLDAGEELRAWVAGCATGEEAYSLAILIREALDALGLSNPVRIFATDIHREALRHAALGAYDEERLSGMSPARRERFFVAKEGVLQVAPSIRSMIVFAPHNVLQDVPFNRLDLVLCRNLLIYLEAPAQRRVLSTFHFSLKPRGMLFLGPSESLAELGDAFETVDTHWKLFQKKGDVRVAPVIGTSHGPLALRSRSSVLSPLAPAHPVDPSLVGAYHAVLEALMPPAILVGTRRNLVQTFGGASRYLRVPEGRVTDDVVEMAASDVRVALTGALGRVSAEPQPVRYHDLRPSPDAQVLVDITVRPIKNARTGEAYAIVTFDEQRPAPRSVAPSSISSDELARDRIVALETELHHARENLQATIEALETSNEELQATNEELMASNEELQTTNEELHSVNQELFTVNTEFQTKITELTQITTDMDLLLASTEVHTLFLDQDLRIRRFTPQMALVFNLVVSDVGRRIDTFNHSLSRRELYDDLRRVVETGESFEAQVSDVAGGWYLLRILPYRREALAEGAVLTLVDITRMKRFEAEARSKSDLLSNILTNSPHPVFVRDREGRYVIADESFRRLASRDPTGLEPGQVFPGEVAAMLTRDDAAILGQGMTVETEETIPTPEGERTFLSVRFPMRDARGDIQGIGGIQTDVTSLKRAEAEAREASNRRDRFLATLSHELRNPLAAVLNAARVLERGAMEPEELERWHRMILERSLHMTRLVDDLLDVARLTQDKLVLERAPMDLCAAAKGVVDEVGILFQERGITLETDFDGELPLVGDATRLHQLQVNLLTNAARHTPEGGRTTFRLRRDGDFAEIVVADTGEGIAPDMLGRIFDLFVQGDQPGARGADRGLGVGLALVRRIAELHGGSVSVASRGVGRGAEFRARIPLAAHDLVTAAAPTTQEAPAEQEEVRPGTVMVVDDDEASLSAMSKLLRLDGAEVSTASSGEAALGLLASGPAPDLVLLDIGLPQMNGYEVCRRIRTLPNGKDLVVFALTGFGQDSDREAAKRAGFDGHLTKPVDVDDVYAMYASLPARAGEAE